MSDKECPKCKDRVSATETLEIHQTPPYLILSLNRLNQDTNGRKLTEFVKFPLEDLNLSNVLRP